MWCPDNFFVSQMKRRHWLLAPQEIDRDAMIEWLGTVPAEWGSAGQGDKIDSSPHSAGHLMGGGCAEVFESFERYDEAIVAAQADVRNWPTLSALVAQSYTAIGRCKAKLGKLNEASVAFEAAISEAKRADYPFHEMCAHRDYIMLVLDAQGKRDSHMAALGECIVHMVMEPPTYTTVLGGDIDAEAAVAAYRAVR